MNVLKSFAPLALLMGATTFAVFGCKSSNPAPSVAASPTAAPTSTAAVKPYPLTKCIVSDEALDSSKSYTFVRDGQEIKLCCKDCLADFDKDPAKYLAKLTVAK
jgi:hypothetical protein